MDVNYFMWSVNLNVSSMHLWATTSKHFLGFKMSMFYFFAEKVDYLIYSHVFLVANWEWSNAE